MFKLLMAICVTLTFAALASAQTASELADRYEHHEVYEVQPGVQMTAKFASNGLVCEMQIEQAHFDKDKADLRKGIDKERVNGLIDQLVPPSERGEENRVDNILSERGKFLRTSIRTRTSPYMSIESWHNRGDGQVAISHVLMVIK